MTNPDTEEFEPIPPKPWWIKLVRGLIAAIAVLGLIYLSGIHQYFLLQKTPKNIEQPVFDSKVDAEEMYIPVFVHILTGESGSERTEQDAKRLLTNANNIWAQANIEFNIKEINVIETSRDDINRFNQQPYEFIKNSDNYNPLVINIFFTSTLDGVNGLAYGGTNAVSVADYTSTLDFRTLAHEFGHLLGLPHVSNNSRLMATGGRGTELTREETNKARDNAQNNFSE